MADAAGSGTQRTVSLAVLLAAGLLSLPVVAAFLDGESTDQLIVPVQVVAMVVVGVVAALLAVAVFYLLLGGV